MNLASLAAARDDFDPADRPPEALIAEAVDTPEWKEAVQRNYWNPVPLSGAELEEFIAAEKERIGTLTEEIK